MKVPGTEWVGSIRKTYPTALRILEIKVLVFPRYFYYPSGFPNSLDSFINYLRFLSYTGPHMEVYPRPTDIKQERRRPVVPCLPLKQ